MQSKLLVFFRKDKGECYTYPVWHFVQLFFRREMGVSFRHLSNTRYETAQVVFSLAFTFYTGGLAFTFRSGVSDEVACAFLVFMR